MKVGIGLKKEQCRVVQSSARQCKGVQSSAHQCRAVQSIAKQCRGPQKTNIKRVEGLVLLLELGLVLLQSKGLFRVYTNTSQVKYTSVFENVCMLA